MVNNMDNVNNNSKSKIIICLYANADCGKTKTIRSLFLKLGGDRDALKKDDFIADVFFGGKKIGFASQGDPGTQQKENIEDHAKNGCDIIVTASRSKGDTVGNVSEIANKYGYKIVWISPFYFYDKKDATEKSFLYFAERNADNIAKYIIDELL